MFALITLNNIHKTYFLEQRAEPVLIDVNLTIAAGEMVAIMGASGSGKSTLMNIIGLLDHPTQGDYLLEGQRLFAKSDDEMAQLRNKTMGFVFQQFYLLPRLTALQNVMLPLLYSGSDSAQFEQRAHAMLAKVGMSNREDHRPNQLSGGQQQRVAIARALIMQPRIVLADEPTGALDSKTGNEVIELFKELHDRERTTLIIVTHDPHIAQQCQRIIQIRDGRIEN